MRLRVGVSKSTRVNDYSQTWRCLMRAPRQLWPRKKYTPTDLGRLRNLGRTSAGRREMYDWKRAQIACCTLHRCRYGWRHEMKIYFYGPHMRDC
jgi:hypothetical protein